VPTIPAVDDLNPDALGDRFSLAHLIPGVTAEAIRQWAKRGRIPRRGVSTEGRTLYRLGDVLAARQARHARDWSLPSQDEVTH
jgi:DNA-binding transcriptional MerR regulator